MLKDTLDKFESFLHIFVCRYFYCDLVYGHPTRVRRDLQCVLRVPSAGVVGVDVHRLGERALDDAAGAVDEPLELGRQHDGLLLVSAQLADCNNNILLQLFQHFRREKVNH